jgi:hypothetical protein
MITDHIITVGTRVRVRGNPSGVSLRVATGTVTRLDDGDGYYIVRLDEPGKATHGGSPSK